MIRLRATILAVSIAAIAVAVSPAVPGRSASAVSCSILPCYTFTITLGGDGTGTFKTVNSSLVPDGAIDCEEVQGHLTVTNCSETYQDFSPGSTGVLVEYLETPATGNCRVAGLNDCVDGLFQGAMKLTASGTLDVDYDVHIYPFELLASSGGTIAWAGLICPPNCSDPVEVDYGTTVTVSATPNAGYGFTTWGGSCSGTTVPCTLVVTGPKTVEATFTQLAALTVVAGGSGAGRITSSPGGIDCTYDPGSAATCIGTPTAHLPPGTNVTLTATPHAGSTFAGWSGSPCAAQGASCSLTIEAGGATYGATFVASAGGTPRPTPAVTSPPGTHSAGTPAPSTPRPTAPGAIVPSPLASVPSFTSSQPVATSPGDVGVASTDAAGPGAADPARPSDGGSLPSIAAASAPADLTAIILAIVIGAIVIAAAIVAHGLLTRRRSA